VKEIGRGIGEEAPREFVVRRWSEGIARIAAAFFPKPFIVCTSDRKTNEYARLVGGASSSPWRRTRCSPSAARRATMRPRYAEGFVLECAALVREEMGIRNVKVMIPFYRTVDEATRVIAVIAEHGLQQGHAGLEAWAMCEVPSNVLLADSFLHVFDGYSTGSNDLTQVALGIDRDSGTVAHLFDERSDAVRRMIHEAIAAAKRRDKPGICGQAPSDSPEFAECLVREGTDSISLNPDVAIAAAEASLARKTKR
jgi:pyruvate,water dikinase